MISWIQRYFQQHFRVIFTVLLGVVIISFVFTIGAAPGIGSAERRAFDREFFGYNLARAEDQQKLMGDAQLSVGLQFGAFSGLDGDQMQNYAFQRAAALHLADQWHVPAATAAEITEAIKKLRMFAGQDGQFDAKAYATFRDNLKANPGGMTEADIARVIGDDVRVEKVQKLLAGPGYVLPSEIKAQLERADTTWTLATATADYAAFKPEIKPADADLTKFFEENSFRYQVPPRLVATYVEFPASSFAGEVSLTDAEVRSFYDANPARFPKPPEASKPAAPDVSKPANADADFAAVRPQVEAALKAERAKRLASKAANDLALAIFESRVGNGAPLDAFLAKRNLTAKPLAPFTRESGPAEFAHSPDIAGEAFKLNKDRFVSEGLETPNGAAVLFFKDLEPARTPAFVEVRERVAADYVESEKRKRFVELGKTIKSQLEARLKAGDSLEKAAAATSGTLKLETKTLPPFTLRARPQDVDFAVLGTLERLQKGEVSDMVVTADKGIFVYAADKKAPDLSDANPRYAETRTQLANIAGRIGASSYLGELVEQEFKRTEPRL